jgi:uncharacterized protein YbjT (DUF2867 family)
MTVRPGPILVTGATGRQGGAVARHLLKDGWTVRARTRDPGKSEALELSSLGVALFRGDLDDRSSLDPAIRGCYGAFSVQNFWETGYEREVSQGKTLADAAKAAGVRHFVYSSVGGADRHSGLPHFDSKWEIEQHIGSLGLPCTILRPVFFMDNLLGPSFRGPILEGTLRMPLPPSTKLQMIAVDDIGGLAALALDRPTEFLGKSIEIAGDDLTIPQAAEMLSRVIGRTVRYEEMSLDEMRSYSEEYAKMFEWFAKDGYRANISWLRSIYPSLTTFDQWVRKTGWAGAVATAGAGTI